MTVFELARLRRPALVAEFIRWCAPSGAMDLVATENVWRMSREALVTHILVAQETGARRR